jgi:hypothetical protein
MNLKETGHPSPVRVSAHGKTLKELFQPVKMSLFRDKELPFLRDEGMTASPKIQTQDALGLCIPHRANLVLQATQENQPSPCSHKTLSGWQQRKNPLRFRSGFCS